MRTTFILMSALGLLLGCGDNRNSTADRDPGAGGDQLSGDTMASTPMARGDTAGDAGLAWGPAPPALPTGSRVAVLSGDPAKPGPFTIRIDMPPDYSIRPHQHPVDEEVRLLEGTLHLGHGRKWDQQAMKALAPDQPVTLPAKKPHYVHAASRVVVEIQSTGPFEITYVDPKDDPRKGSTP